MVGEGAALLVREVTAMVREVAAVVGEVAAVVRVAAAVVGEAAVLAAVGCVEAVHEEGLAVYGKQENESDRGARNSKKRLLAAQNFSDKISEFLVFPVRRKSQNLTFMFQAFRGSDSEQKLGYKPSLFLW